MLLPARLPLRPYALAAGIGSFLSDAAAMARVTETGSFGSNPGALRMFTYAPPRLPATRPLVVVLHGCGQEAARFAGDAGWLDKTGRLWLLGRCSARIDDQLADIDATAGVAEVNRSAAVSS